MPQTHPGSLEDRTSLGYSVSCTSCNLCKEDRVVCVHVLCVLQTAWVH